MDRAWLDSVFNTPNNDCFELNNFYYDKHEHTNPILNDTVPASQFKVIHSVTVNAAEYEDPDNPFPELSWSSKNNEYWSPPEPAPNIPESCHDSFHFINDYYPDLDLHPEDNDESIRIIKATSTQSFNVTIAKQSDSGANTCATNNIHLLCDVKYIKPVDIKSATKNATPMKMMAVGTIPIRTTTGEIRPTCFYSPDVDGIIVSPDAIARKFSDRFKGFTKMCDCTSNRGYLSLDSISSNQDNSLIPLISYNNLWYHEDSQCLRSQIKPTHPTMQPTINSMSNAASFELWHQRLGHPGRNIMDNIHKHSNVPQLRGNSFWKCPSCMSGKFDKSYHMKQVSKPGATKRSLPVDVDDDIYLPNAKIGQHFHCDFGFVRSKDYNHKDDDGRTQTSIDGKNSYLLIIDRKTRYTWVYVSSSKVPPLEFCQKVLNKFKSSCAHKTIRCDQGELANSQAFNQMIDDEGFTLQVTGADNSKQNGMAERPHRTYGNMMRCVLHSAGLGPEYWSFALLHCVYLKNRLPHRSINMSPYEAITTVKPDLSGLRIFGSRVYARTTEKRTGKLDMNNIRQGIFVGFTGTMKNVYYIDDLTKKTKIGSWIKFDEAHSTVPAQYAPMAAQALQRLGYNVNEIKEDIAHQNMHFTIKLHSKTAKAPHPMQHANQYTIPLDIAPTVLKPNQTKLLPTGFSITTSSAVQLDIKQKLNEYNPHLIVYQGTVDTSNHHELCLIVHNSGPKEIKITEYDDIAFLQLSSTFHQQIPSTVIPFKRQPSTTKSAKLKQSDVDKQLLAQQSPTFTNNETSISKASKLLTAMHKLESAINLNFELPYDLQLSSDPYDHYTSRFISLNSRHKTLGMKLQTCPKRNKPQLLECIAGQTASRIPSWRRDLKHSYITAVNDVPVSTTHEVAHHIAASKQQKLKEIKITFATLEKQSIHPQLGIPQIYHDQLSHIAQQIFDLQHEQDESTLIERRLHRVKKQKFNTFTLSQLKQRDDWDQWNDSIFKQLDQYHAQNTFDMPEKLPPGANLLSLCWVYLIKLCGTLKARCVCNGSPRFRGTVTLAETYASALDQTGARCFWAAAALNNYIVIGADASNAFAEAPPPVAPLYVRIDANYKRWYKARFPDKPNLPDDYVLRVRRALQGHPESPRLWAILINKIIVNLKLQPCTHEQNLYYTNDYNSTGKTVLFLRQVDDFAIACQDETIAEQVIKDINSKMSIDVKKLGIVSRYNGVDIDQRREYIKLHACTYLEKLEAQHSHLFTDLPPLHTHPLPMDPSNNYQHELETAEALSSENRTKLEHSLGFTYRQAVGEIIYSMITCRPDISFAIIKLSQYSTRPAKIHYDALKHLYRYLFATKHEGIHYWRKQPRLDLPKGNIPVLKMDANYDEVSVSERQSPDEKTLFAYVDSNHATDVSTRKSVSGYHVTLAGGAVFYKTQIQSVIAQSSTEAEFIAASDAGKYILYLRTIMEQIGIPQENATILYEDNQGALLMARAKQPTKRTKHIDIRYFALQDWVERDLISMKRIATADNSSDALTKATARTLFYRHNNHILGRLVPSYVKYTSQSHLKISKMCISDACHPIVCLAHNIYTAIGYHSCEQGGL